MQVVVVGAGALGCLYAARLSPVTETLVLTRRGEHSRALEHAGIRVESDGSRDAVSVRASASTHGVRADVVLLLTKAYDTAAACESIRSIVGNDTIVVTLQNGLGNDDVIAAAFGEDHLVRGVTTEAATLLGVGRIRHAASGVTTLESGGRLDRVAVTFAERLQAAGFRVRLVDDARPALWEKLAMNAAINGVTALLDVPNGLIARSDALRELAVRIVDEVVDVAARSGVELEAALSARALDVAQATAQNISSMLQDVRSGRRTEADAIYGAIVRHGRALGTATPYNAAIALLLLAWEETHLIAGGAART